MSVNSRDLRNGHSTAYDLMRYQRMAEKFESDSIEDEKRRNNQHEELGDCSNLSDLSSEEDSLSDSDDDVSDISDTSSVSSFESDLTDVDSDVSD